MERRMPTNQEAWSIQLLCISCSWIPNHILPAASSPSNTPKSDMCSTPWNSASPWPRGCKIPVLESLPTLVLHSGVFSERSIRLPCYLLKFSSEDSLDYLKGSSDQAIRKSNSYAGSSSTTKEGTGIVNNSLM